MHKIPAGVCKRWL